MLRGRDELYGQLNEAAFAASAERYFTVVLDEALPNGRILYLLQAK